MEDQFQKTEEMLKKAGKSVKLNWFEKRKTKNFLAREMGISPWYQGKKVAFFKYAVVPVAIVLLVGGSVAEASRNTLPGDLLYPVKTAVYEPLAGLRYAGDKEEKLAYQKTLAERRLIEMAELGSSLDSNTQEKLLNDFDNHRKRAKRIAAEISVGSQIALESDLESALRAHGRIIEKQDLKERIQTRVVALVKERSEIETKLSFASGLEAQAKEKEQEARSVTSDLEEKIKGTGDERLARQAQVQVDLAMQEIEKGNESIKEGSYAKAVSSFEKAKRLTKEANIVFQYAVAPKEVSEEEIALLAQKTELPEVVVEEPEEEIALAIQAEPVNIYDYFQESLERAAGPDATPEAYLSIFPSLQASDFDGIVSNGGIYQLVNGELVFVETLDSDDGVDKTILESEGYERLLINIATRVGVEISTKESIDIILNLIKVDNPLEL